MSVGSFEVYRYPNEVAREEIDNHPRRRQVASIILISPTGQEMCLCVHEGAKRDRRLNMSPPQGGLEPGEQLEHTVIRELREELGVNVGSHPIYLGSVLRKLPDHHSRAAEYDDYHHHWFAVFALNNKLYAQTPITEASWWRFDTVRSCAIDILSKDKAPMTLSALRELAKRTNDPVLVRREHLLTKPAGVFIEQRV